MTTRRFDFAFAPSYRYAAMPFGIRPGTAVVEVGDGELRVRFGPWRLHTPVANVESTWMIGPFAWLKMAGPAHLSLSDRGVTFATNGDRGLCLTFRSRVPAIDPTGHITHPNATLTVADPEGLRDALAHGH